MTASTIRLLATGGTIAGRAKSASDTAYVAGKLGLNEMLEMIASLGLNARFEPLEVAAIGSQDIGWREWDRLHAEITRARGDERLAATIITHGTDTAEETAFLLDLALDAGKPVVLVGAMRPANVFGSDGMRNFANAVRVASDPDARERGVLVVMGDWVFSARDVRKAATSHIDAFKGFPRGPLARVTPSSLDWFGPPDRAGAKARFAWPGALPRVEILTAAAGMDAAPARALIATGAQGIVLAGMGQGNAPAAVIEELARAVQSGLAVVRSSRVDEGMVERNVEIDDDACGFVAARAHGPAKARILLAMALASGMSDPQAIQAEFDRN